MANYVIILWWFLPYIGMNQPRVYMCPPSQIPLPPHSLSHPSGLSQYTGFECPVSCVELGLVIHFIYGNIHVSMLFFQTIPPSLSPQSPKVCSLYLCLFCCLMYRVIVTINICFLTHLHTITLSCSLRARGDQGLGT